MKIALLIILSLTAFMAVQGLSQDQFKARYADITGGHFAPSEEDMEKMFDEFLITYKSIQPRMVGDYAHRFELFKNKVNEVMVHNQDPSNTWRKGINKFSDWTDEEFRKFYRLDLTEWQNCSATASPKKAYNGDIPKEFDWKELNDVTPVKNQGHCGSCWTFSTVGAMEAHALLAEHSSPTPEFNFTEQQLVDCAGDYDNHGCSGGLPSHAFEYIKDNGGLEHRRTYPYNATDLPCVHNATKSVVTTSGSFNITQGDEKQLHESIYHEGPVSVSYQVIDGFRDYESGVYTTDRCGNTTMDVNHAVLAVGYGFNSTSKLPYYHIKNSWGPDWGDEGYFKIEANKNMCAIATCNSYPLNVTMIDSKPSEEQFTFTE